MLSSLLFITNTLQIPYRLQLEFEDVIYDQLDSYSFTLKTKHFQYNEILINSINICNSSPIDSFKSNLLKFICPISKFLYNIHNTKGIQLLTKLWLAWSHLDTINSHEFMGLNLNQQSIFFSTAINKLL